MTDLKPSSRPSCAISSSMASAVICLFVSVMFTCAVQALRVDLDALTELKDVSQKKSDHSIDYVDNDPEFLVGVKGIDKPLCFNTEGSTGQVIRLLQDPETGVLVNARIFHDDSTNKTYLGAIAIALGNFRILAKQRLVMVNDKKFDWGIVIALSEDGHRVVIGEDMIAVTFRRLHITLVIRRHFASPDSIIDYEETDRGSSKPPTATSFSHSTHSDTAHAHPNSAGRADIIPVIGYEQTESLINHFLSSKRRRSLFLQKYFGINQDQAVVRNLIVQVDSDGRKKRESFEGESLEGTQTLPNFSGVNTDQLQHNTQQQPLKLTQDGEENEQMNKVHPSHHHHHFHRHHLLFGRHRREVDDYDTEVEKRGELTIYLGIYIADSRDFTNKTHGLLGQFLFKNVTLEKMHFKNGRMKARLLINANPSRRTIALLALRHNMALNATRACWKIRHQGRDVIDGRYSDYEVPNLRYTNLKELPPPAPL